MPLLTLAFAEMLVAPDAQVPSGPSASSLVGSWRLVRYADTRDGGVSVEPFGASPGGLFIFTADHHASISIMRDPP